MIEQLSIYTENTKGTMRAILSELSKEGINILGFVNSDSAEFGTARLIVSDTKKAYELLTEKGYLCRTGSVLGAQLEDRPGAMEELLSYIERMNINVSYMYLGYLREPATPVILISCQDLPIVAKTLSQTGYTIY